MTIPQVSPEEARCVDCHEAGHAVVAVRHQLPFLTVVRGDDDSGEISVGVGPIENPEKKRAIDEIARWQEFYAAGAAAEMLMFGLYQEHAVARDRYLHGVLESSWRPNRRNGWECDIKSALRILDRKSVDTIANALEKRKKLSDTEVFALLGCTPAWH